jgi:hypothetical protein
MTITTTKTVPAEKTIPVPCFWKFSSKSVTHVRAVLDEETFVEVFITDQTISIDNSSVYNRIRQIKDADERWNLATEEEFFEAYRAAYQDLNLMPKEESYLQTITSALQLQPKEYLSTITSALQSQPKEA